MKPLQMLLARLIDPQSMNSLICGNIGRPNASNLVALLVTETTIYQTDFNLREMEDDATGWKVDGSYNLQIAP